MLTRRLREAREKKGLSQRELARLCDFGVNQINRYEKGISDPISSTLRTIAQQLGVSTDYLLGLVDDPQGDGASSELNPDERELLDMYRHEGWRGVIHLSADRIAK